MASYDMASSSNIRQALVNEKGPLGAQVEPLPHLRRRGRGGHPAGGGGLAAARRVPAGVCPCPGRALQVNNPYLQARNKTSFALGV